MAAAKVLARGRPCAPCVRRPCVGCARAGLIRDTCRERLVAFEARAGRVLRCFQGKREGVTHAEAWRTVKDRDAGRVQWQGSRLEEREGGIALQGLGERHATLGAELVAVEPAHTVKAGEKGQCSERGTS